jgi:hypothetical protein
MLKSNRVLLRVFKSVESQSPLSDGDCPLQGNSINASFTETTPSRMINKQTLMSARNQHFFVKPYWLTVKHSSSLSKKDLHLNSVARDPRSGSRRAWACNHLLLWWSQIKVMLIALIPKATIALLHRSWYPIYTYILLECVFLLRHRLWEPRGCN